jgi:CheY-like chemotaxis protein
MNRVLIIDESPFFREYLRLKLSGSGVDAAAAINALDGIAKIRSTLPDLIIMDYHLTRQGAMELLRQKQESPSTAKIPLIVIARQLDQKKIIDLLPYNVKKVFTKPVKTEALFSTLSEMLGLPIEIDRSPGVVEVHVNDDIIFVEITLGLNRDKLDLLWFKIRELLELYQIKIPKLIVMISGFTLGFADGPNIQKLLDGILQSSQIEQKNIRILTRDEFVRAFITEQKQYEDIEVVSSLQYALEGLIENIDTLRGKEKQAALIEERVLSAEDTQPGTMELRFDQESKFSLDEIKEFIRDLHITVVDDDEIIRELVTAVFTEFSAPVRAYSNGAEFISSIEEDPPDLIFLDLMMPKVDGFAVLRDMQEKNITTPVIILSAVTQKEAVIRAFQLGTKSYLIKPLKAADIFKKTLEILRVNF